MHAWGNGTCRRRLVSLVVAVVSLLTVASAQAAELLVGNVNTDQVLRYDGTTGAFLDAFVAAGSGGLDWPSGPRLRARRRPLRQQRQHQPGAALPWARPGSPCPPTGQGGAVFVAAGSGGLDGPFGLVFGPDGALYVSSGTTSQVLRYNGTTGAFLDAFVAAGSGGLNIPSFLTFGPRGPSGPRANLATISETHMGS